MKTKKFVKIVSKAYDILCERIFNKYFDNDPPKLIFCYVDKTKKYNGWFVPKHWTIMIMPKSHNSIYEGLDTALHELVHAWQFTNGNLELAHDDEFWEKFYAIADEIADWPV